MSEMMSELTNAVPGNNRSLLPEMPDQGVFQGAEHDNPRQHPHRPTPDPRNGALIIDPDILLKAKKFNLNISFFYSSRATSSREFGIGRGASFGGVVQSDASGTSPVVIRGDFRSYNFDAAGSSGGVTHYTPQVTQGATTTLSFDGTKFTEYFNDGIQLIYQAQITGGSVVTYPLVEVKDASGVAQTYTYGSGAEAGLLKSIQVPGGNLVTFLYTTGVATSLLQTVQDWSGRRWTFQYDSQNHMTTMTTPMGCQTGYSYGLAGSPTTVVQAITDPRGFTTSYQYDSHQRVTTMSAGTAIWAYAYNVGSQPNVVMVSPSGAVTTTNYDSQGNVGTIQHPEGYTSTFAYDQTSFLRVSETVPAGTLSSITYDQTLWLPTVSEDALGNRTTMQYDAFGNLTTLIDANNATTTFAYAGTGSTYLRIRQTDPLGQVTSYSYTADGLLLSSTTPRGLTTTMSYDANGNMITMMASDGTITTYGYDSLNRQVTVTDPLGRTTTSAYDAADNKISITDPTGATTTYVYNTCLLQAVVNPLNQRTTWTYGRYANKLTQQDAIGNTISWNYDNQGYLLSTQDSLGNFTTVVYNTARQKVADQDQLGNLTSYTYDSSGRLVSIRDSRGNVSTTVFNARNDVVSQIDALGNVTGFFYDNVGRKTAVLNALGFLSTAVYDAVGQVIATVDPLSYRTTFQYDADGNVTTVTDANGHISGNIYQSNNSRLAATVDANGFRTSFQYDAAGQQIAITNSGSHIFSFSFNEVGQVKSLKDPLGNVTTWLYDAAGRNTTLMDAKGNVRTTIYDAIGQLGTVLYADGTRITLQYDALNRRTAMQDSGGTTTYIYTSRSELSGQILPSGSRLTMQYDSIGNRTLLIDPDGGRTTYSWDAQNNLIGISNPYSELTTIQYDALNREKHRILANGMTTSHTFDQAGRETVLANYGPGGTPYAIYTNTYDHVGNRLTVAELDGSLVTYTYDVTNQLTNERRNGTTPYNTTFSYDGVGNRLTQNDSGILTTYTYNNANQLTQSQITVGTTYYQINCGGQPAVSPFTFDAYYGSAGTIYTGTTGLTIDTSRAANPAPMAVYQSLRYMNNNDPNPLFYVFPNLTPGATYKIRLHWATYADAGSGHRKINVLINGQPVISHLDVYATALAAYYPATSGDLKAITQDVSGIADGAGNLVITFTADTGYMYVSPFINAIEVLIGSGVVTSTYDPNGNLLTATDWTGITTCTWDNENRLTSVANSLNGIETYTYDGDGLRRQKVTSAQANNFVWDGGNVFQERDVSNVRLTQYTSHRGWWGSLVSNRQGSTSYFYNFDSQGSSRQLVDYGGTILDSYAYRAFGLELAQGQGPNAQYTTNPYRYVGQYGYYRDMISRLYVRARYIDANQGRWLSQDPIGSDGGDWNFYRYAFNNSVTETDPAGLQMHTTIGPRRGPAGQPCIPEVYACFRDISYGGHIINHTFFWIHWSCNPAGDHTIGYGPWGSYDPLPGQKIKGTPPEQPEDYNCIQEATCNCRKTNCNSTCVTMSGDRIGKGRQWDPHDFSPIIAHKRCWDFTDSVFEKCGCAETGPRICPGTVLPGDTKRRYKR